jgi:hypothetical protein
VEELECRLLPSVVVNQNFDGLVNPKVEPPDSDLAAGPSSIVQTVNRLIRVSDKMGNSLLSDSLTDFFNTGTDFIFDPRVIYDDITNKFYVVMIDFNAPAMPQATASNLVVAISNTSTPGNLTTDWTKLVIPDSEIDPAGGCLLADYPALGWNADGVVISHNMRDLANDTFSHMQLVSIDNANHIFINNLAIDGSNLDRLKIAPARMHASAPGSPMWLVEESRVNGSQFLYVIEMNQPFSAAPSFTNFMVEVPYYYNDATTPPVQPNGSIIATGDTRILDAAMRGTDLVACHYVSDGTEDQVRWYQIDISNAAAPKLVDCGRIDRGPGVATYVPCIEIAPDYSLGLSFLESSATEYMSMYVTGRRATDPPGTLELPVEVAAGRANYQGTRFGDNSGASVDPVNGSFWVVNELATNANRARNWADEVANFTIAGCPQGDGSSNDREEIIGDGSDGVPDINGTPRATGAPDTLTSASGGSGRHAQSSGPTKSDAVDSFYAYDAPFVGGVFVGGY